MKRHTFGLLYFFLLSTYSISASTTDTIQTWSEAMKKNISALVVTPEGYSEDNKYPVVYMLHGYSGSFDRSWIKKEPTVEKWADLWKMILVVPDGGYNSWYFDSPINAECKYETFMSKELVNYIDSRYSVIKSPKGRAIVGLSMGGHGAFYLSFRHQNIYGAAGSICGGVDLRPFPLNWDLSKVLGNYSEYPSNWEDNTVINLTYLLTSKSLALKFDCGSDDFFYKVNCQLHEKLLNMNIPHEFTSAPGSHTAQYWDNAIDSHLLFFHKFFETQKTVLDD